jgi:hypothetical protein
MVYRNAHTTFYELERCKKRGVLGAPYWQLECVPRYTAYKAIAPIALIAKIISSTSSIHTIVLRWLKAFIKHFNYAVKYS